MPWFLNPNIYNKLPIYQNPELYLFIFKLAVTAVFAVLLWKRGMTVGRLVATTYIFFYGTFITVMLFMHNFVILGLRIFGDVKDPQPYDFHLYSLILLGSILIYQGIRSLRAALMLKAGDENGARQALRATWVVLAVAVPLIPIQFFGVVLTVFSLLNLAVIKMLLARRSVLPDDGSEKTLVPA
jgi:hypothetical protein